MLLVGILVGIAAGWMARGRHQPRNTLRARCARHHLYGTPVIAVELVRGPFGLLRRRIQEFELSGRSTPYANVPWQPGELDAAVEEALDQARLVIASSEALGIAA